MAKSSLLNQHQSHKICTIENCEQSQKARGLCGKHYHRWERHGDPNITTRRSTCSVPGCNRKHDAKSYCHRHYSRFCLYGDATKTIHNVGVGESVAERFWSRVDKETNPNGCWIWLGSRKANGYGTCFVEGKQRGTHRASWFFTYGEFPTTLVRHKCDNPSCVNPEHLERGSHLENMQDLKDRNRQAKGEKVFASKLTIEQVKEIKVLFAGSQSNAEIAEQYGVSTTAIRMIRIGETWRHVE